MSNFRAVCDSCASLVARQVFVTMAIMDTECESCGATIRSGDANAADPEQWKEILVARKRSS